MKSMLFFTSLIVSILSYAVDGQGQEPAQKQPDPVPVVQPKGGGLQPPPFIPAQNKKNDGPPAAVQPGEEASVLPMVYVKNRLDIMPNGTKAYISVECVKCDSKRRVFLDPDQLYGTQNEDRIILVSKDITGYHLSFEKLNHQWTCQELPTTTKWLPVKTITAK